MATLYFLVGDSILIWHRKTCPIAGNMGMVGVRDNAAIDIVEGGGDAAEMQDYKGRQREEYIQIDEDGGVAGQLRHQQKRCCREAG